MYRTCRSLCLLLAVLAARPAASTFLHRTAAGLIEGRQLATPRTGRPYLAFTGVPYAKPPLGPLRLKNPVAQSSWPGVLDATQNAPICTQTVIFVAALRNVTFGQEDCLYLNIYTPSIDPTKRYPVLVYVHGGGFRCGRPVEAEEAPTNFMEEDVVLVTVHYRLGTLGFLSTENSDIPGNFGLKDQAMAMKWISENIEDYGGNPNSITVFGESAGGASAHYLITSPLSRDLLKNAIAESGVVDATWALAPPGRPRRIAKKLAEIVNCPFDSHLLTCLQNVDPTELILAETKFLTWDFDPSIIFQPVIEVGGSYDSGAFLIEDPRDIEVKKPLITGIVPGEGILKTAALFNQDESVLDDFINNIDNYLPDILFIEPSAQNLPEFISAVKGKYFKDLSNRKDVLRGMEDMYQDAFFVYPMHQTLVRHKGPLYVYLFDHRGENSLSDRAGSKKFFDSRPCHGDEILSLFNWTSIFPGTKGREPDRQVSSRLVKLWVNFGKYQNPTPPGSRTVWNEYTEGKILHIKTYEDTMARFPYNEAIEFWKNAMALIRPSAPVKEEL